jgi:hypothetical protein
MPSPVTPPPAVPPASGRVAVLLMVGLGAGLALFAILHQRNQTFRCLRFLGAPAARRIAAASHVELMRLRPGDHEGRPVAVERWDISSARGVVHLRRGLVEDANYDWSARDAERPDVGGRLPAAAWRWGIAFADSAGDVEAGDATILALAPAGDDRGKTGWMTLVGAAGRVRLGRIDRGISTWIEGFLGEDASGTEPAGLGRIGKEGMPRP